MSAGALRFVVLKAPHVMGGARGGNCTVRDAAHSTPDTGTNHLELDEANFRHWKWVKRLSFLGTMLKRTHDGRVNRTGDTG